MLLNGRIAGVSGITGRLLRPHHHDLWWRIVFLGGLIAAPIAYRLITPLPPMHIDAGVRTLIVAELLAGIGTRYGGGCTSGHGVCGLSRCSPRSVVATLAFMAAGVATVLAVRHVWHWFNTEKVTMQLVSALVCGLLFGLGLILSGMTDPVKVTGFLDIAGQWDPSLGLVMGGAMLVGLLSFPFAKTRRHSVLGEPMQIPISTRIDGRLVGGLLFGIGWGLAGYCPGPAFASVASAQRGPIIFVLAKLAGMETFEGIERLLNLGTIVQNRSVQS